MSSSSKAMSRQPSILIPTKDNKRKIIEILDDEVEENTISIERISYPSNSAHINSHNKIGISKLNSQSIDSTVVQLPIVQQTQDKLQNSSMLKLFEKVIGMNQVNEPSNQEKVVSADKFMLTDPISHSKSFNLRKYPIYETSIKEAMTKGDLNDFYINALLLDRNEEHKSMKPHPIPLRFIHEDHYTQVFQPLLFEEVRTAISSSLDAAIDFQSFKYIELQCNNVSTREQGLLVDLTLTNVKLPNNQSKHQSHSMPRLGQMDDLLLLIPSKSWKQFQSLSRTSNYSPRRLIEMKLHYIGIVTSNIANRENNDYSTSSRVISVVMLKKSLPSDEGQLKGEIFTIISIESLSTFTREYIALKSISNHNLMPLSPYLLKGLPVVSLQQLR